MKRWLYALALFTACDGGSKPAVVIPDAGADAFVQDDEGLCNPVLQVGCGAGEKCTLREAPTQGFSGFHCDPEGMHAIGTSCAGVELDCVKGGVCVGGACRRFCFVGEGTACPAADTCTLITPAEYRIGACVPTVF